VVAKMGDEVDIMTVDHQVWLGSIERLSKIFSVPKEGISLSDKFGVDLKPSFVSDFRDNELDVINNDIHDVADKRSASDLSAGRLVIETVNDYCEFMVRCSRSNAKEVMHLLKIDLL